MRLRADGHWAPTLALLAVLVAALAAAAPRPVLPGTPTPSLDAPGVIVLRHQDQATTKPMLLVFSKQGDQHTAKAIEAIVEFHQRHTRLRDNSRTTLVLSRSGGEAAEIPPMTPAHWRVLHDSEDELYASFGIIATPTSIVVGVDGRTVGFHPGYNASLADAIRRDLIAAIDGPEALAAATPTPGIMNVQMGRQLAKRKLYDRALEYYQRAAEAEQLPCSIMLEMVEIHIQLEDSAKALQVLDGVKLDDECAGAAAELRERAQALEAGGKPRKAQPPTIP